MGLLVDGIWHDQWYDTDATGGDFKREAAKLRNWVTKDGSAGPTGGEGFPAESGRYHLYASLACPWAHRTLIFRKLKQLEGHIGVSVVATDMMENGWTFALDNGSSGDSLYQSQFLREIYTRHNPTYSGRVTVPVLWDKARECIVNNESADIIRMFNSAFNGITGDQQDFYPERLRTEIDEINQEVYENINNGVYRCGFATGQKAYEQAYVRLFASLEKVEGILNSEPFLTGDEVTEADWRLFTTLTRFDCVYYSHFKCNKQRIEDFPNLRDYFRRLLRWPGVASTVNFDHIKRHYYFSQRAVNPTGIVPLGPAMDYISS